MKAIRCPLSRDSCFQRLVFSRVASGFSLVEVTLALGIAGFCMLVIVGMLPVGLGNNRNSIEQSAAANLARCVVADLRAAKNSEDTNKSPQYEILFSTSAAQTTYFADDGTKAGSVPPGGCQATTTIDADRIPASVRIKITWPAAVAATAASEAFEIITAIDRCSSWLPTRTRRKTKRQGMRAGSAPRALAPRGCGRVSQPSQSSSCSSPSSCSPCWS